MEISAGCDGKHQAKQHCLFQAFLVITAIVVSV